MPISELAEIGAAQPFNNGFADGQSQSCALCEAIHLDETFKDLVQLAGFDADAGVADVELYPVSFAAIPIADFALGGEFKGVSDKVGYHLEDAVLVSFDGYLFVRRLVDEFPPADSGTSAHRISPCRVNVGGRE